ncbi:hypothetical protein CASFOL_007354 [Castilleja foliolosa]|uniref:Uncharacterized protein n=1 Tax=Castilleja foliolosa TaxID=1961234 RepID=A0ABD3ECT7_9LAMI
MSRRRRTWISPLWVKRLCQLTKLGFLNLPPPPRSWARRHGHDRWITSPVVVATK